MAGEKKKSADKINTSEDYVSKIHGCILFMLCKLNRPASCLKDGDTIIRQYSVGLYEREKKTQNKTKHHINNMTIYQE